MDEVARFSEVGDRYGEQLSRGLRLTGETAEYYARRRIARMRELAARHGTAANTVLDFGCGTGASFALLRAAFPGARIIGLEPAAGLRAVARDSAVSSRAEVLEADTLSLDGIADVVYCNGVFHHIVLPDRAPAMQSVARALRDGGLAFVWENSPYNPGTRVVMSRIPFDRDARLLTPHAMRLLQRSCGVWTVVTEYNFVFPRALSLLRPVEPLVRALPLGGQYVVLGRRRGNDGTARVTGA